MRQESWPSWQKGWQENRTWVHFGLGHLGKWRVQADVWASDTGLPTQPSDDGRGMGRVRSLCILPRAIPGAWGLPHLLVVEMVGVRVPSSPGGHSKIP